MTTPRKLFYYNAGFLCQRRLRHILSLAGYRVSLGLPGPSDMVAVWGQSPDQYRGQWVAAKRRYRGLKTPFSDPDAPAIRP